MESIKSIRLSHSQVRYLLLPFLALALVHFVAYQKLPFDEGYQFPLVPFVSVLFICIVCCEANTFCYKKLSQKWSLRLEPILTIIRHMGTSLVLTTVIFAILVYSLNYMLFGYVSGITHFLSSLFIALLIITVETLVYILRDFKRAQQADIEPKPATQWQYRSGNKTIMTAPEDIAYIYSQKGLVYVVTRQGDKHLTHYNSLNELSDENDTSVFFRLNRQFMVSAPAIASIEKEVNQKLKVRLTPESSSLPVEAIVSRYNSPEFKRWIKNA